jgi:hypothetical protein
MGTALLILVLLALCGFIAYIGDLLGRRLGKKRLSIFGLRPKHTAILLTIVTGVLIAGVTFGAALLSIPMFRTVVTQGERLAGANRRLQADNRGLERQNRQAALQNRTLVTEAAQLQEANTGLMQSNEALGTRNRELDAQNRKLEGESKELQGQNAGLQEANARLAGANARLQTDQKRLQEERKRLATQVEDLRNETEDLKGERYVLRRGFQLGYRPIPANPREEVVKTALQGFLLEVEQSLKASAGAGQEIHLVVASGKQASRAELERLVAEKAAKIRDQPLALRAVAVENTVVGRPARILVDLQANALAFRKGEPIAETRIDGSASLGTILEDLIRLLQSDVRRRALEAPHSMLPDQDALGEMNYDPLLDVAEQVRAARGLVRVVARARQDTYRAGKLYVDLEVSSVAGPQAQSR